jgi:hypothetical protein
VTAITVLYEDQRAKEAFGPHELLLGMVADATGLPWHQLGKRATAIALNGVDKLLAALKDAKHWARMAPGRRPVLAIVDADEVRKRVGTASMSSATIEERIRKTCSQPDRLTVVLLENNLETVIEAIRDCDPRKTLDEELVAEAMDKDINARDLLLQKVGRDATRRDLRDCVRKKVPSLNKAVEAIRRAVAS